MDLISVARHLLRREKDSGQKLLDLFENPFGNTVSIYHDGLAELLSL